MVKKYIRIGIVILISLLAVSTYTLYNRNQDLKEEISVSMTNQKAFIAENSSLNDESRRRKKSEMHKYLTNQFIT